ncbi:MAG: hypothetical protein JWR51_1672 [Devosia sp.]|uniref:hypothetical protein n=1 Tax=Devosia sp. TaxID=1871048 RepID=UPI002633797A|nr:hypothetical protein [Devosia sp.]MDB5528569.1 hypothetical protein [Devosia sp.]
MPSLRGLEHFLSLVTIWILRDKFPLACLSLGAMLASSGLLQLVWPLLQTYLHQPAHPIAVGPIDDLIRGFGVVMMLIAVAMWLRNRLTKDLEITNQLQKDFLAGRSSLEPGQLQNEFKIAYGFGVPLPQLRALLDHPENPEGLLTAYPRAGRLLSWDGNWFVAARRPLPIGIALDLFSLVIVVLMSASYIISMLYFGLGDYGKMPFGFLAIALACIAAFIFSNRWIGEESSAAYVAEAGGGRHGITRATKAAPDTPTR